MQVFMVWIGGLIVRKWLDGSKEIGMNGCRICVVDREGMMVREWSECSERDWDEWV